MVITNKEINGRTDSLTELRFNIPPDTKYHRILEMLFPANLLGSTEKKMDKWMDRQNEHETKPETTGCLCYTIQSNVA